MPSQCTQSQGSQFRQLKVSECKYVLTNLWDRTSAVSLAISFSLRFRLQYLKVRKLFPLGDRLHQLLEELVVMLFELDEKFEDWKRNENLAKDVKKGSSMDSWWSVEQLEFSELW